MNKTPIYALFVVFALMGSWGCNDDTITLKENTALIEDELKPYFDAFALAGSERNIEVDYDGLEIVASIAEIENNGIAGHCRYSPSSPRLVTVDRTYWDTASESDREILVFHELGHCYLNRGHRDAMVDGACISLMNSVITNCTESYPDAREDYLDELFE